MIEEIKIKNTATYSKEGIIIDNIDKINFIYGTNGCGKTTLSRLLNDPSKDEFSECEIKWKNNNVLKTFVYNKEFREKNFGESDIAGIFTLGQAGTEQINAIREKKKELDDIGRNIVAINKSISGLTEQINNENASFREVLWKDIYKNNEIKFRNAFTGFMKKDSFSEKLQSCIISDELSLDRTDIETRAEILLGEQPTKQNTYSNIDASGILEIETAEIWAKCIAGKKDIPIANLIESRGNGDWVNQGRKYIGSGNVCTFCQKNTIDNTFRAHLEMFFDEEFEKDIQNVHNYKVKYEQLTEKNVENISVLLNQGLNKIERNPVQSLLESIKTSFKFNLEMIDEKIKEPGRKVELSGIFPYINSINKFIQTENQKIVKNNTLVDNFKTEKEKLITDIWLLLAKENSTTIEQHKAKIAGLNKGKQSTTEKKAEYEEKSFRARNQGNE